VIFTFSTGKSKKDSLLQIMAGTLDVNGGVDQTIQLKTERLPFDFGYQRRGRSSRALLDNRGTFMAELMQLIQTE
jgi:hypothetical protein